MEGVAHVSILIALGAGLVSFLSPCVLPLFPSYLSLITGTSLTELEAPQDKQRVRRAVIGNSLAFIAGFSAIFIALGASFSLVGRMLLIYQDYLRIAGGILIIAFGIIITGMVKIPALARYYQPSFGENPTGLIGTGLVGATFAIGWTPCVGPILGAILLLASTQETVRAGVVMLVAYSAGLAIPFFLSALTVNAFFTFFRAFRRYIQIVHIGAGVILIAVGFLLVTDYFTILNAYALRFTPKWLIQYL
jgi:cytochrome c-type biogenesis protein